MASGFEIIKLGVTGVEKGFKRLVRSKYCSPTQYPPIIETIKETIDDTHIWLENRKEIVDKCTGVYVIIFTLIGELESLINQLSEVLKPKKGANPLGTRQRLRDQENLARSITSAMGKISENLNDLKNNNSSIFEAFEKGLEKSFDKNILSRFQRKIKFHITERGEKTYMFPWSESERESEREKYHSFIEDKVLFRVEVVDKIHKGENAPGHKLSCKGPKEYVLCGKRANPRKTIVGEKKRTYEIRMVKCKECGQRFSLLPSFLPREKNYGMDTIGIICEGIFLRTHSIHSALRNTALLRKNRVKSRQTILNWMRWMGTLHPALILTRAGIKGSGYLQEDEGFEKEPNLRTYSIIMVDPKTQIVWHSDYVDHVDEATLTHSFEEFLKHISFKVLGVTKDKWLASTKAVKNVFHGIWIGYCHRHCLKNLQKALKRYQTESNCSAKERSNLYKKFKKVLKTSTSKVNLMAKVKSLKDSAFQNPILAERVSELKENATHYTSHKRRKGVTQTTSIVDNFLKRVKKKLIQVESFRDEEWARLFFKGIANVRNFLPFVPGSKNANKSPFGIAGGKTYDLPWAQVMNVHDGFLFSKIAC